jgi:hypothetical protein
MLASSNPQAVLYTISKACDITCGLKSVDSLLGRSAATVIGTADKLCS